jgi:hypothetical protein
LPELRQSENLLVFFIKKKMYTTKMSLAGTFFFGVVLVGLFVQSNAWSGYSLMQGRSRIFQLGTGKCVRNRRSAISMAWSPEERARRAELARQREEKISRERAERQRQLEQYDETVAKQRSSNPTNFEAAGEFVMPEGNYGDKAQGLFGWANNNPSSKNAIYDLEFINSKAGGGNVGEMMTELRGKGRTEEGREVQLPGIMKDGRYPHSLFHLRLEESCPELHPRRNMRVFYRETGTPREGEAKPAVVFIHGLLDHRCSSTLILWFTFPLRHTCSDSARVVFHSPLCLV